MSLWASRSHSLLARNFRQQVGSVACSSPAGRFPGITGVNSPASTVSALSPQARNISSDSSTNTFRFDDLRVQRSTKPAPKPDMTNLKFGHHLSDHMLQIHWSEKNGWSSPVVQPLQPLVLHPAAKVLHYATELFEGLKAFRSDDNQILLFRPDKNMERMNKTAARAVLPTFDGNELIKCMARLIDIDRDWAPSSAGSSLYIRPCLIGTEGRLGVHSSTEAILFVVLSPVGSYFHSGAIKPVRLLADPKYVRAWPGGAGSFKMGSNYGPALKIQNEAEKLGCQQVLWLFGPDHQITEVGAMNLMIFWVNEHGEKELITAPLEDGLVLPGVTRDSLLTLCRDWNEFKVSERRHTLDEVKRALDDGRMIEIFAVGTAAVVSPVGEIAYEGDLWKFPTFETQTNPLSMRLMKALQDIQYGRSKYSDWTVNVDELLGNRLDAKSRSGANQRSNSGNEANVDRSVRRAAELRA